MAEPAVAQGSFGWYVRMWVFRCEWASQNAKRRKFQMLTPFSWFRTPLSRNYESEHALPKLEDSENAHPLTEAPKSAVVVVSQATLPSSPSNAQISDPLSPEPIDDPLGASSEFDDPLSAALSAALGKASDSASISSSTSNLLRSSATFNFTSPQSSFQTSQDDAEDQKLLFAPRKAGILTKYTTTETITIPGFVAGVGRRTYDSIAVRK